MRFTLRWAAAPGGPAAIPARLLLAAALAAPAFATDTPEVEPNDTKATATPVVAPMNPGDTLSGVSTSATGVGLDYFRVRTAPRPGAIYRHRLTITSSIVGHTGTLRGLNQTAGVVGGTDSTVQTSSTTTTPPRFNQWYGFGQSEEIYYRVTGAAATTAPYLATLTSDPISPTVIPGTFDGNGLTITTVGQGHTSDTDLWVYDANFNALVGFGNDDEFGTANAQSRLVRNYCPGTYYLALTNFNFANNRPSPADDDFRTGLVLDFPGAAANSSTTVNLNLTFSIIASNATVQVPATKTAPFEILWFQFEVAPGVAQGACCLLGGACQTMCQPYCLELNGVYAGDGTLCGDVVCCDVECAPGDLLENEPDCGGPPDTVDGGCNSVPPVFLPIACGQRYCGTYRAGGGSRDTDWYELVLTQSSSVTWCVHAEAEVLAGILENNGVPNCAGVSTFRAFALGARCADTCVSAVLPAGTWWLFVAAQNFQDAIPCGAAYQAEVTCAPAGACCFSPTVCTITSAAACSAAGGSYAGDGTSCGTPEYTLADCGDTLEDISATGTQIDECDDCGVIVPTGFRFPFFGNIYENVGIASNGYLHFGAQSLTDLSNDPIPNTTDPDNLIAVWWDDLNPSAAGSGNVYWEMRAGPSRLIVQWDNVQRFSTPTSIVTCQAILYANGTIDLRYARLDNPPGFSASVGIENADGTVGISIDPLTIVPPTCKRFTYELNGAPCVAPPLRPDFSVRDLAVCNDGNQIQVTFNLGDQPLPGDGPLDVGVLMSITGPGGTVDEYHTLMRGPRPAGITCAGAPPNCAGACPARRYDFKGQTQNPVGTCLNVLDLTTDPPTAYCACAWDTVWSKTATLADGPAATYTVTVAINPDGAIPERDPSNNSVSITRSPTTPDCAGGPSAPCSVAGPGPHWMHVPPLPPGTDSITTNALVAVDLNFDGIADQQLILNGPTHVRRGPSVDDSAAYPGVREADGHLDVIDTEILSMSLAGPGITLTAGAGQGAIPLRPTLGAIAEAPEDPSLADSFFDVFFEIDLGGGQRLYNQEPLRVRNSISCVPPDEIFLAAPATRLGLFTSPNPGQGDRIADLLDVIHDPFPRLGACCLPSGQCVMLTAAECVRAPAPEIPGGVFHGEGTNCLGDGNGNGVDDVCEDIVPPGDDCWVTECGETEYSFADTPIPCSFFDPGSEPFDGSVRLEGDGAGGTDTRMSRLDGMYFGPALPAVATTRLRLSDLLLRGCDPITVTYCTGVPDEQWRVRVDLSTVAPPLGTMTVSKTHANGGTFTSEFRVQPRFTFTRIGDGAVRVLDTGELGLPPIPMGSLEAAPWVHSATISAPPDCGAINFKAGIRDKQRPGPGGGTSRCVSTRECCVQVRHGIHVLADGRKVHAAGRICVPCPCGACCLAVAPPPWGNCTEISSPNPRTDCEALPPRGLGGVYQGNGSSCASTDGDAIPDLYEKNNCCTPVPCGTPTPCNSPTDPKTRDTDGDGLNDDVDPAPCNRCLPLNAPNRPAICDQFDRTLPGDGDCDDDGMCDLCEIELGLAHDCNNNGVPDSCEPDCNGNGLPDDYDIACGSSADDNGNGVPDECECRTGDANCDGVVDNGDIDCFVAALLDSSGAAWQACALATNPACTYSYTCTNDLNRDGVVDNGDIDPFVACLLFGPPPGESCP